MTQVKQLSMSLCHMLSYTMKYKNSSDNRFVHWVFHLMSLSVRGQPFSGKCQMVERLRYNIRNVQAAHLDFGLDSLFSVFTMLLCWLPEKLISSCHQAKVIYVYFQGIDKAQFNHHPTPLWVT